MPAILLLLALLATVKVDADAVCARSSDIIFFLDGSSSICNDAESCPGWNAILDIGKSIVNAMTIGKDHTNVALVTLSKSAELQWGLREYEDKQSLLTAIGKVRFPGGKSRSDIVSMAKIFDDIQDGNRLGSDKLATIILITDGPPVYTIQSIYEAASHAIPLHSLGIFVVCLKPECAEARARGISSPFKKENVRYFFVDDNRSFDTIRDDFLKEICDYNLDLLKPL